MIDHSANSSIIFLDMKSEQRNVKRFDIEQCSIAPFSLLTRRFRPSSLIKQTQGSKHKEFY